MRRRAGACTRPICGRAEATTAARAVAATALATTSWHEATAETSRGRREATRDRRRLRGGYAAGAAVAAPHRAATRLRPCVWWCAGATAKARGRGGARRRHPRDGATTPCTGRAASGQRVTVATSTCAIDAAQAPPPGCDAWRAPRATRRGAGAGPAWHAGPAPPATAAGAAAASCAPSRSTSPSSAPTAPPSVPRAALYVRTPLLTCTVTRKRAYAPHTPVRA